MPVACIRAYAVVGPTKRKPRRLSSLASAMDSGVVAGTSANDSGRRSRGSGAYDHSSAAKPSGRSVAARAFCTAASILARLRDAGVEKQARDVLLAERRDLVDHEVVERGPEGRALAEDRQPGQPRLERLEGQPLVKGVVVADGSAPLLVVVGEVLGGRTGPSAPGEPVGADDEIIHHGYGRTPDSTIRAKRRSAWVRLTLEPGHRTGHATLPAVPPGR